VTESEPLTKPEIRRLCKLFILLCAIVLSGWIGIDLGRREIAAQIEVSPIQEDLHDAEYALKDAIFGLTIDDANVKSSMHDALHHLRHAERFARKILGQ